MRRRLSPLSKGISTYLVVIISSYQTKPHDEVHGHPRDISAASDMPFLSSFSFTGLSLHPQVHGPRHTPWRPSDAIRENHEYM
jgi:hypothetical protein